MGRKVPGAAPCFDARCGWWDKGREGGPCPSAPCMEPHITAPLTPQWKARSVSPSPPGFAPKMHSGEQSTAPSSSADSQLVSGQIAGLGPELGIIEQK